MKYRVKDEFVDSWTSEDVRPLIVTGEEIKRLAREWDVPVSELMEEVEEEDENKMTIKELEQFAIEEIERMKRGVGFNSTEAVRRSKVAGMYMVFREMYMRAVALGDEPPVSFDCDEYWHSYDRAVEACK